MAINDRWVNTHRTYQRRAREEPYSDRNRSPKRKKTIIFELTLFQFFVLVAVCFLSFVWMFSLGFTIGKQFPEDEARRSLLQKIAIALGYARGKTTVARNEPDKQATPPPGEMQLNLAYHQELSKPVLPAQPPAQTNASSQNAKPQKQQRKETTQTQKEPAPLPPPPPHREEKEIPKPESSPTTIVESTGEKYTVLVASFKSAENAGRLEQMLRSKGYIVSRQETVIRNETWYRVLVGNFDNRESAQKFTAMFNEKEGLKGVVVRK